VALKRRTMQKHRLFSSLNTTRNVVSDIGILQRLTVVLARIVQSRSLTHAAYMLPLYFLAFLSSGSAVVKK